MTSSLCVSAASKLEPVAFVGPPLRHSVGCVGRAIVVTDPKLESNPGILDKHHEQGRFIPGDFKLYLPDSIIGNVRYLKFSDREWQERVEVMIQTADLAIVDVATQLTKWVQWEIETSLRHLPSTRVLLLGRTDATLEDARTWIAGSNLATGDLQCILYRDNLLGRMALRRRIKRFLRELI